MRHFIFTLLCLVSLHLMADNYHFAWNGKMGDDINIRLDLEEDEDGLIVGQTTYFRKNGKTSVIKIYGRGFFGEHEGDKVHIMILEEFNGTKECGIYILVLNHDLSFREGEWTFGDKTYPLNSFEDVTPKQGFIHEIDMDQAQGVYKFSRPSSNESMPEYGGYVQIYADAKNIAYDISQVTPNIAETHGRTSEYYKNTCYITIANARYRIHTYQDCVYIKRDNPDEGPCENFGMGADIEGIYLKTKEEVTGDILHAFDEEQEFSKDYPFTMFALNEEWEHGVGGETTFPDEIVATDIDHDGNPEYIARYIPDKTSLYEVRGKRQAVFTYNDGKLECIACISDDDETLYIADGYVITNVKNNRGTRDTDTYYKLEGGKVVFKAAMTRAKINNFTIDGKTVSEKDFKKQVKVKKQTNVDELDGWITLPGNQERNENAARG